ncbi:MAG: serine/threonine-protein phosphatase [Planctomycetota bacterium]|nr:serine/threonine-protein phosphatase [Planctomycetota bacterium]
MLRLVRDDEKPNGISAEERAPGTMIAVDAPSTDPFSLTTYEHHLEQLEGEINNLRAEIDLLRRRDETLKFYMHRLDEELRLAARLQQDFLPKTLPQLGQVFFHTLFRPAGYVSGDLYDVMRLDESHVGFYMADAVGHGMPAALLTMFMKNALITKQITPGGYRLVDPSEALANLNSSLVEQHLTQATFATAVYGMVNVKTLMCRFARAGHPCPLLLRGDGSLLELSSDGGLLGIFPNDVYADGQIQLIAGDRLIIYSDGIEVAFADDQTMNTQQWRRELEARRDLPGDELLADLCKSLDRETGSLTPKDDLSVVIIEVRGN